MTKLLMAVAVAVFVAVTSFVSAETYEIPTECPNSLNETIFLAHEYDCTKYYKCFNGQKQSMDCPVFIPGHKKYFDVVSQSCILPWKSKCQAFDCFTDGYVQSHPYNCSLYYVCTNGEKVENSCKEGELFDSKSMKCVAKEKATCNVYQNTCPNGKFGPVFLPHECKCQSLYYECVDGEFIEKHCQKGKDFDVETGKCVLSQNVGCNPTTTTNDCPATGIAYIPDKFDCSSYYVCKDGVKSKKVCDFGLSYNEERSMCTWPPSSMCSSKLLKPKKATPNAIEEVISRKCPPKGSEEKAVKFPHECSCAIYYECNDGQLLRETCPNGLIYDYVREVCDYPYRAKCAKKQKFNYNFARANSECPPTGHARIPHETKCSLYYECNNGKKRLQSCLQGHYFNPLIESCDLPWNTNCNNSPTVTPPNDSNSTSECTECDCNNCITRFPDPQNCSLYYQCENGEKVSKACPEHLYYDSVNQICDFPNNVDCKQKCKEGEKQQHECQCNKYYECINGQQVLKTCPNGQYFDRKKKICVESHTCPDQVDIGCIGTCSSFHSTEYLLHKDCDKHCVCENGSPYIVNCPKKQVYNPKSQTCDWPENVANLTCDPFPCDSNSKEDYLPHECHCDKYFVCRNGMKYRENCGEGKYFDYEKEICVNINQVHCYRGKKLKSES